MIDPTKRLLLVASDYATMNQADEMFRRVRETMIALDRFMQTVYAMDEDAPDLHQRFGDAAGQMFRRIVQQYPNPRQFDADLETLKGMRTQLNTVEGLK